MSKESLANRLPQAILPLIPEGTLDLQDQLEELKKTLSPKILCLNGAHSIPLEECSRLHWGVKGQERLTVYVGPLPVYKDVECDIVHIPEPVLEAVENCIKESVLIRGGRMQIIRPANLTPIEIS